MLIIEMYVINYYCPFGLPPLINKMVGEPFYYIIGGFLHNAKASLTTRAGGLFVLQSSVFRINEKLLNGEQGPALRIRKRISVSGYPFSYS